MIKKINYSEGEIKNVEKIDDFLPPPEDLVLKNQSIKITLSLSKDSVAFFKDEAYKHHIPYQRIIKTVLDKYADHYKNRKKA